MDEEIRRANRSEIEAARALGILEQRVASLERSLNDKHAENRRDEEKRRDDVHNLRGQMQKVAHEFALQMQESMKLAQKQNAELDEKLDKIIMAQQLEEGRKLERNRWNRVLLGIASAVGAGGVELLKWALSKG